MFKLLQAIEKPLIGQSHSTVGIGCVSRQPHVNKRNPIPFLVFPLLDGIRLEPQFRVKQQASNVLIETRHCYLGGLVL
jgi:hypothetical protein